MSPASESPIDALTELSGTVLEGRYELGRVLGAGGMGAVFEARHLRLDRPVAIKVLRPVFVGHTDYIRRFLREAKSASSIRHRNVVEILDYGEADGGLVYSVMEFLVGEDLEELLRRQPEGRLPWHQACGLLAQVANGLKAAHEQGVIHRDIKPANCFLTQEDGEPLVKLVDFGIAKVEEADQTHQLTATAQVLGTPNYIAPELVRTKHAASAQSDIYSFGVLAYRMLIGRVPFSGDTVFELLRKACFDQVPSLREQVTDIPEAVERFTLEMLAKEPNERPASMLEVRDRLRALGRETNSGVPIKIPPLDSLPVADEDDAPRGAMDRTTVPREAAGPVIPIASVAAEAPAPAQVSSHPPTVGPGFTQRVERPTPAPGVQASSVLFEPLEPAAGSETSQPDVNRPQKVVIASRQESRDPVHDPNATPSHGGTTTPSFADSTLRLGDTGALDRRSSRRGAWLFLATSLVLTGVGAVSIPALLESSEPRSERAVELEESKTLEAKSERPPDAVPATTQARGGLDPDHAMGLTSRRWCAA